MLSRDIILRNYRVHPWVFTNSHFQDLCINKSHILRGKLRDQELGCLQFHPLWAGSQLLAPSPTISNIRGQKVASLIFNLLFFLMCASSPNFVHCHKFLTLFHFHPFTAIFIHLQPFSSIYSHFYVFYVLCSYIFKHNNTFVMQMLRHLRSTLYYHIIPSMAPHRFHLNGTNQIKC